MQYVIRFGSIYCGTHAEHNEGCTCGRSATTLTDTWRKCKRADLTDVSRRVSPL
jgi:hypothetical protein